MARLPTKQYTTFDAFQRDFEAGLCSGLVTINDRYSSGEYLIERILSAGDRMKGVPGYRLHSFNGANNRKNSPSFIGKQFHQVGYNNGAPDYIPVSLQIVSVSPTSSIVAQAAETATATLNRYGYQPRTVEDIPVEELSAPAPREEQNPIQGKFIWMTGSPRIMEYKDLEERIVRAGGSVFNQFVKGIDYIVALQDVDLNMIRELAAGAEGKTPTTIDEEQIIQMTR